MALNIVYQDGDQMSLPVVAGVLSGEPYLFGNQPCVALTDRGTTTKGINGEATLKFNGVAGFVLADALAEDPVYINVSTFALSLADTGAFFGVCIEDADATTDIVAIRIGGISPGASAS